jgi:hypothetical protein
MTATTQKTELTVDQAREVTRMRRDLLLQVATGSVTSSLMNIVNFFTTVRSYGTSGMAAGMGFMRW